MQVRCLRVGVFLLGIMLFLTACFGETHVDPTKESTTLITTETTQETQSTTQATLPSTEVTTGEITYLAPSECPKIDTRDYYDRAPILPIPADNASEEDWISFFYGLLSQKGSWYNAALTCQYSNASELDLRILLSGGISSTQSDLTSQELAWLIPQGYDPHLDCVRMPSSEIDTLLNIYFGTSLTQYNLAIRYYAETDCYYYSPGGPWCAEVLGIVRYEMQENGDILVCYADDYLGEIRLMGVTLRPVEQHYLIVSNLPLA